MAVIATEQVNRLRIRFENGTNPTTGSAIFVTNSWGNVKAAAPDQDVYDTANALVALSSLTPHDVLLNEGKDLSE
ncbi:MAG: DUF1659 domain-containing protein [Candidatus Atribacteria bacterium]|nr:DUF1659 domain-containing protein [Candidatus Atribacteria bacterium]